MSEKITDIPSDVLALTEAQRAVNKSIEDIALDHSLPFLERVKKLQQVASYSESEFIAWPFTQHHIEKGSWVGIKRRLGGMFVGKLDPAKPYEIYRQPFKSRSLDVVARFASAAIIGAYNVPGLTQPNVLSSEEVTEEFLNLQTGSNESGMQTDGHFVDRLRTAGHSIHVGVLAMHRAINADLQFGKVGDMKRREIVHAELTESLLELSQRQA